MTLASIARIAKIVALIGFLLPWVLVSCANQPAAHLTGLQLAIGSPSTNDVPAAGQVAQGHPDVWIALSLALVVVGLAAGLALRGSRAAMAMATTSAAALALAAIGVWRISSGVAVGGASVQTNADALVQAQAQYGFIITAVALLVCFGASVAWLTGDRATARSAGGPALSGR